MPRPPRHVRIFLASPGDVLEERLAARELMLRLEREPLVRRNFTIEVVSWDDPDAPAPMLATLTPQQAVARALPSPSACDATVVILWRRMGTPLEECKPDGTPYLSGTEWEFEDARRAGRPILLYRRTTAAPPTGETTDDAELQQRSLEKFFGQFLGPRGALRGSITTYETVDEFVTRLRKDIESLLPSLQATGESLPPNAGWVRRARAKVRRWSAGRLVLVLPIGLLISVVATTAATTFPAVEGRSVPALAYIVRYLLIAVATITPLSILVLVWWWSGRQKPDWES